MARAVLAACTSDHGLMVSGVILFEPGVVVENRTYMKSPARSATQNKALDVTRVRVLA